MTVTTLAHCQLNVVVVSFDESIAQSKALLASLRSPEVSRADNIIIH